MFSVLTHPNQLAYNIQIFLKVELEMVQYNYDITLTKMDILKIFIVKVSYFFVVLSSVYFF